jgi:hypothetical protein
MKSREGAMNGTVFYTKKTSRVAAQRPMDPEIQKEQQEEDELLKASKEQKEEQVRAQIVEKYGLQETDDAVLIEQLVIDRLEDMKKFGTLVGQKRNWREKATKPPTTTTTPPPSTQTLTPEQIRQQAREETRAELESRDLEELNLPDNLKTEVQRLAKIQNVSIRKAAQDPYILSKKETYDKQQKEEEAAISRKSNNGAATKKFSVDNPPQPNMDTHEGRKEWADYKEWLKTQKQ